jgi:hypothetical protein
MTNSSRKLNQLAPQKELRMLERYHGTPAEGDYTNFCDVPALSNELQHAMHVLFPTAKATPSAVTQPAMVGRMHWKIPGAYAKFPTDILSKQLDVDLASAPAHAR